MSSGRYLTPGRLQEYPMPQASNCVDILASGLFESFVGFGFRISTWVRLSSLMLTYLVNAFVFCSFVWILRHYSVRSTRYEFVLHHAHLPASARKHIQLLHKYHFQGTKLARSNNKRSRHSDPPKSIIRAPPAPVRATKRAQTDLKADSHIK